MEHLLSAEDQGGEHHVEVARVVRGVRLRVGHEHFAHYLYLFHRLSEMWQRHVHVKARARHEADKRLSKLLEIGRIAAKSDLTAHGQEELFGPLDHVGQLVWLSEVRERGESVVGGDELLKGVPL